MVSKKVLAPVIIVILVFVALGAYGPTLNKGGPSTTRGSSSNSAQSTTSSGSASQGTTSSSTSMSSTCGSGICTTIQAIVAGTYTTATDKQGTGGTTVTVQGLKVLKVLTESDGDWHVYVTDGKFSPFITEIIPRDQAAEGKPPVGQVIDETGTPYCDTAHQTESWHGDTCWEIHPVTAWHLSSAQVAVTTTNAALELNVTITVAHDPIARGDEQNITATIWDADGPVNSTSVHIHVTYASGSTTKDDDCSTSVQGSCSYAWTIGGTSNPGTFQVVVTVEGEEFHASFQVNTA